MWIRGGATCAPLTAPVAADPHGWAPDGGTAGHALHACEHFVHEPSHGITVLSCDPSRINWNACVGPIIDPKPRGALWVYDGEQLRYVPIDDFPDAHDFHPLGIALWDMGSAVRVFATNHATHASSVEVIDLHRSARGWRARFVRTVAHPVATHAVNSLVALSPTSFIVTNTHTALVRPPPVDDMRTLLAALYGGVAPLLAPLIVDPRVAPVLNQIDTSVGFGFVAYVSFESGEVAANVIANRLMFPNGIALTPSRKALVVSSTVYPGVLVYSFDGEPDWAHLKLGQPTAVHLPFFPDNIALAPRSTPVSGDPLEGQMVVVAGHPSGRDNEEMKEDPRGERAPSPSWVVEVAYVGDGSTDDDAPVPAHEHSITTPGWRVHTILQTNGRGTSGGLTVPAATTAAWIGCRVMISTLFLTAPVVCSGVTE